jgi:hypothetical protein
MNDTRFHEEQRFAPWVYALVVPIVAGTWGGFIAQVILGHRVGNRPAPNWVMFVVLAVMGIALPALFASLKLVTDVTSTEVRVALRPLKTRVHRLDEIAEARAITYSPLGDYGGWGIRYGGAQKGWAYNTRGDRGVRLTLKTGQILLIGSGQAEDLQRAIESVRGGR